jgi:phospholipid/cholesterol/gamma-HCH transport system permease protein
VSASITVAQRLPRIAKRARGVVDGLDRIGGQAEFYAKTLIATEDAVTRCKSELIRLIAQMSLGTGALVMIGGTTAIVGFLTLSTGALVAVQGYNQFSQVGVEALIGFASAFFNVRLIAPLTAGVAMAATIGAGATAQIGAMRINEEIDALEVMGMRSVAYLASTRVIAGVVVVIPEHFSCCSLRAYPSCRAPASRTETPNRPAAKASQ